MMFILFLIFFFVSMITDYPDNEILSSLRETIGLNWNVIHNNGSLSLSNEKKRNRIKVLGYKWGDDVSNIIKENQNKYFDVALLSECLWMHREHIALAASLNEILTPDNGIALLTYAHHVPGCEEQDLDFFNICRNDYGMDVCEKVFERDMPYMWNKDKITTIYLATVRKVS